jgi:hypothetical protein
MTNVEAALHFVDCKAWWCAKCGEIRYMYGDEHGRGAGLYLLRLLCEEVESTLGCGDSNAAQ